MMQDMAGVKVSMLLLFTVLLTIGVCKANANDKWINIDYVRCMKNQLPCYCEKVSRPFVWIRFDVDSDGDYVESQCYGFNDIEPIHVKFKKDAEGVYKAVNNVVAGSVCISSSKDTLYYFENNKRSVFVRLDNAYLDEQDPLSVLNISLLKDAFALRGKSIQTLLKHDTLYCSCNKWLGKINLIAGGQESWVIERRADSVYVYKYLDEGDVAKSPAIRDFKTGKVVKQDTEKKKLIARYKWER